MEKLSKFEKKTTKKIHLKVGKMHTLKKHRRFSLKQTQTIKTTLKNGGTQRKDNHLQRQRGRLTNNHHKWNKSMTASMSGSNPSKIQANLKPTTMTFRVGQFMRAQIDKQRMSHLNRKSKTRMTDLKSGVKASRSVTANK
jgi:hypothetical protein